MHLESRRFWLELRTAKAAAAKLSQVTKLMVMLIKSSNLPRALLKPAGVRVGRATACEMEQRAPHNVALQTLSRIRSSKLFGLGLVCVCVCVCVRRAAVARPLRGHCGYCTESVCGHCASVARPLCGHCAAIARPLCGYCASVARPLCGHCAATARPLGWPLPIGVEEGNMPCARKASIKRVEFKGLGSRAPRLLRLTGLRS
jgi:hypothetical protein